jgi:hypothetical protein
MKIKAGVCNLDEIQFFAENGAGEVYFGLSVLPSHIRSPECNVSDFSVKEMTDIVSFAHSKQCGVYVAVNEINALYINEAISIMQKLMSCGIDGFIVSSPEVIMNYPETQHTPKWHLSSLAFCLNRYALEWYKKFGFSRFVIYQHFLPEESIRFFKDTGMESEVFFLSDDICANMDGLCKGCSGNLGERQKFCQRSFSYGQDCFKCLRFDIDTEIRTFYSYSRIADWLKLVRLTSSFSHRKKIFSVAKELLRLADSSLDLADFRKAGQSIFLNLRKMRNEN